MPLLDFNSDKIFFELDAYFAKDAELIQAVKDCFDIKRLTGLEDLRSKFRPDPKASYHVSEEALAKILAAGINLDDISTEKELSNCVPFNFGGVTDPAWKAKGEAIKRRVDALVAARLQGLFKDGRHLSVFSSGRFWYPPEAYMGWHTNLRTPGWRVYFNYAEEPGKSFFRYRDPETGTVVTSWDKVWNFRMFRITTEQPLWHAIYSETNRFSLGYRIIRKPTLTQRVKNRLAGILQPA